MKKATIVIQGMHCASCASNTERSLRKVPGVRSASVSLLFKKGTVDIGDGSEVTEEQLKDAVKRAGYEARSISFS